MKKTNAVATVRDEVMCVLDEFHLNVFTECQVDQKEEDTETKVLQIFKEATDKIMQIIEKNYTENSMYDLCYQSRKKWKDKCLQILEDREERLHKSIREIALGYVKTNTFLTTSEMVVSDLREWYEEEGEELANLKAKITVRNIRKILMDNKCYVDVSFLAQGIVDYLLDNKNENEK